MIIFKVYEHDKYLCSFQLETFQELRHWIINHLDISIYEQGGYNFEAKFW